MTGFRLDFQDSCCHLFLSSQPCKAVGKGVGDAEVHQNATCDLDQLELHSEILSTRPILVGKFDVDEPELRF